MSELREPLLTPFKVGDRVRLKSGGPVMTVVRVDTEIVCCWFREGQAERAFFPLAALEAVPEFESSSGRFYLNYDDAVAALVEIRDKAERAVRTGCHKINTPPRHLNPAVPLGILEGIRVLACNALKKIRQE